MNNKEFLDLAAELEEKCGDWENSKGLSEEALKRVLEKAEEMDRKGDFSKERKVRKFRLKKRYLVVLAAALTLLMGIGVVGDRAWIADSSDLERETEVTTKIDTEEKQDQLREEEAIYQEIGEKLGIAPMWLGYMPEGMVLDSYVIMEDTGWAYVNYLYHDNLVCVQMMKKSKESSNNVQWDGDAQPIDFQSEWYDIEAYVVDDENQNYGANIVYGNGYYNILGTFSSENEFLEILNKIYFKTV